MTSESLLAGSCVIKCPTEVLIGSRPLISAQKVGCLVCAPCCQFERDICTYKFEILLSLKLYIFLKKDLFLFNWCFACV